MTIQPDWVYGGMEFNFHIEVCRIMGLVSVAWPALLTCSLLTLEYLVSAFLRHILTGHMFTEWDTVWEAFFFSRLICLI